MRTLVLGVIIVQLAYFFCPCMSEEDDCVSCTEAVNQTLSTVTTVIKSGGYDPYTHPEVEICQAVTIANFATLKPCGGEKDTCSMPCKEEKNKDCYIQRLRLSFDKLNVTCNIGNIIYVAKLMCQKAKIPFPPFLDIKIPSIGSWFGKKSATTPPPPTTELYCTWKDTDVFLEMLMCYDDDKYEMRRFTFSGTEIRCWCGGSSLAGQACGLITKMDVLKRAIGGIADKIVQALTPKITSWLPADTLSMLNCGDKR